MKIYIFHELEQVSNNYHSGGGAAIIARDLREAKKLVQEQNGIPIFEEYRYSKIELEISDEDWKAADVYKLTDNTIQPRIYVFPDAGCC